MTIVSISLNKEILEKIDELQNMLGFAGRSEIVRAGIRNLLAEERKAGVNRYNSCVIIGDP